MIGQVQMERGFVYSATGKPCERSPVIGNNLKKNFFENKREVMMRREINGKNSEGLRIFYGFPTDR
jgi:hypothetical protein